MPGRRRTSLGNLLAETAPVGTPVPEPAAPAATAGPLSVPLDELATNPLNARDVHARPDALDDLVKSLRQNGQVEDCTVVTRAAFLAIFPEHADAVAGARFVQVSGGRRHAAAPAAGLSGLDVAVKDHLAASRATFIAATLAENADRDDLDPIEEARQVDMLARETRSNKAAADQLGKSAGWVTQRLNLLLLIDELQAAVRTGEIPVREVRDLHRAPPAEQLAALRRWRVVQAKRERRDEPGAKSASTRPSKTARAVRDLGDTPDRRADTLFAELPADELRALVDVLLRRLDG